MRYKGQPVGHQRTSFVKDRAYDYRQLAQLATKDGLKLVRPNGNNRVRGSRRIFATLDGKRVYSFSAVQEDQPNKIVPVHVGFFSL